MRLAAAVDWTLATQTSQLTATVSSMTTCNTCCLNTNKLHTLYCTNHTPCHTKSELPWVPTSHTHGLHCVQSLTLNTHCNITTPLSLSAQPHHLFPMQGTSCPWAGPLADATPAAHAGQLKAHKSRQKGIRSEKTASTIKPAKPQHASTSDCYTLSAPPTTNNNPSKQQLTSSCTLLTACQ